MVADDDQCHVLMIEDDPAQIRVMRLVLRSVSGREYLLQHACTLKAAREQLSDRNIDVVLLDLNLTDSRGRETFDSVIEARPDLPVIILSGTADESLAIELVKRGAQDYLIKGRDDRLDIVRSIKFAIERKKIQEEKKQLQIILEQESRLEALGVLASGVAHEINTPLQFVGTNMAFLKKSFQCVSEVTDEIEKIREVSGDPEKLKKAFEELDKIIDASKYEYIREQSVAAIEEALDGVSRVNSIVNAMNIFARRNTRTLVQYDVRTALEEALTISRSEWKYIADIKKNFSDAVVPIMCCPEELCQVFLNLIINAAHAIRDSVSESDDAEPGSIRGVIEITLRGDDEKVEVWVSDTGDGIPSDIRHRVFEPFFTTKQVGRGSGQGLAIAHGIVVDKHKGNLSFETEPGHGTVFKIELPVFQSECHDPSDLTGLEAEEIVRIAQ